MYTTAQNERTGDSNVCYAEVTRRSERISELSHSAMSGRTADRNRSTQMTGPWGRADTAPSAGVGAAFFEAVVEAPAEAAGGKHSRNDRCRPRELAQPTPSRRWHFSGRAAGPFRKRSFASQAAKSPPGDSGRSRVASTARYKHAVERLHLKAANRRCRP